MAVTNITAAPFTLDHPSILIGDATSGVQIECAGTNLTAEPNADENTTKTFCGNYTNYSIPTWTVTVTIAQSYGADGAWTLIHPLCGTVQPFAIKPDIATASVDNPVMTGEAFIGYLPFIDAAPGEVSEVDLVLGVQGEPDFGITDPVAASASSGSGSGA